MRVGDHVAEVVERVVQVVHPPTLAGVDADVKEMLCHGLGHLMKASKASCVLVLLNQPHPYCFFPDSTITWSMTWT